MTESAPYQPHSETSKEAAERIEPNAGTLKAKVLAFIRRYGPVTDEMIQRELDLDGDTERPRRIKLVQQGFVRNSGEKYKTSKGGNATLWEAVK